MTRFLFVAPLVGLLMAAGTASADYLLVKVNVNPKMPTGNGGGNQGMPPMIPGGPGGPPAGMAGMAGGAGMGGMAGMQPPMGGMGGRRGGFAGFGGMGMGMGGMAGMAGMGGRPPMGMPPGAQQMGQKGGAGMPPGGQQMGQAGGAGTNEPAADAEYLYVYIDAKRIQPGANMATIDHPWGKRGMILGAQHFITFDYLQGKSAAREFAEKFKKDVKDAKGKVSAEALFRLANLALSHSLLKEYETAMDELGKLDPNTDPVAKQHQPLVQNYQRVQKELKKTLTAEDPSLKSFIEELRADGFRQELSAGGHYALWTKFAANPTNDALVKHKLARLETTFASFYYWFAMQAADQPALPPARLAVVMTEPGEYQNRRVSWGVEAPVADGFTPRRDNVLFLASKRQDPLYSKLEAHLRPRLNTLLKELAEAGIGQDTLYSGKAWDDKRAKQMWQTIARAQTMLIVQKALEEDAERATITYEGTRQLLVGSGMFPRHVSVPEWVLSGLASYFETPIQAAYAGVGLPSWTHLISFKHLQKAKVGKLADSADVLYNTVTDRYFAKAHRASELAQDHRDDDRLAQNASDAWELARCTAWAYVYYLASNGRINDLVKYGKELNQLPRDMDLSEPALQACAAKAFGLSDAKNASRIDIAGRAKDQAGAWFSQISDLSLDMPVVENFHQNLREEQSRPRPVAAPAPPANRPGFPPGFPPNGMPPGGPIPPGFNPMPPR